MKRGNPRERARRRAKRKDTLARARKARAAQWRSMARNAQASAAADTFLR